LVIGGDQRQVGLLGHNRDDHLTDLLAQAISFKTKRYGAGRFTPGAQRHDEISPINFFLNLEHPTGGLGGRALTPALPQL